MAPSMFRLPIQQKGQTTSLITSTMTFFLRQVKAREEAEEDEGQGKEAKWPKGRRGVGGGTGVGKERGRGGGGGEKEVWVSLDSLATNQETGSHLAAPLF